MRARFFFAPVVPVLLVACGGGNDANVVVQPGDDAGTADTPADTTPVDVGSETPASCTPTSTPPAARGDVVGAMDPTGTKMVVFGGDEAVVPCPQTSASHTFVGETWVLDTTCGTWKQFTAPNGPSARARASMVAQFDAPRALLFGGRSRAGTSGPYTLYNDVWAYDFEGNAWSQFTTSGTPPSARSNSAVAYSTKRGTLYVFGGNTDTTGLSFVPQNDTFALTNSQWTEIASAGVKPPAREFHAMAIDDAKGVLYVFGGGDANAFTGPFLNDVWALDLDGGVWREVTTAGTPPTGRIGSAMVFDSTNTRLLVFGGHDDSAIGNANDLWALDLTKPTPTWSQLPGGDTFNKTASDQCNPPADFTTIDKSAPERREAFAAAPNADGSSFTIYGGKGDCGVIDDAWTFTNGAWTQLFKSIVGVSCLRYSSTCSGLCG